MSSTKAGTIHEDEYHEALIEMLQIIWGEGFMSPGGEESIDRIVHGVNLTDKHILDVGCGLGGVDCFLASRYGARVTGIDIEPDLVKRSARLVAEKSLNDFVTIQKVSQGPLPFDDNSFDYVFGKDSWLHIEDKKSFFEDLCRVLKPGGQVLCGDWLGGAEPTGKDFDYFLELEGISYHLVSTEEYSKLLMDAGFITVETESIWKDYCIESKLEYEKMKGPLFKEMTNLLGIDERDHFIENWRMLTIVLDLKNLMPTLVRATKPI